MGSGTRLAYCLTVQIVVVAALSILMVSSVALYVVGRRFARRFAALYGRLPPASWMFHKADDDQLETNRRVALGLLPFYLVALVIYLFRP